MGLGEAPGHSPGVSPASPWLLSTQGILQLQGLIQLPEHVEAFTSTDLWQGRRGRKKHEGEAPVPWNPRGVVWQSASRAGRALMASALTASRAVRKKTAFSALGLKTIFNPGIFTSRIGDRTRGKDGYRNRA